MIQIRQESPNAGNQNKNPSRLGRLATFRLVIEPWLRLIGKWQTRSHQRLIKQVLEEKEALLRVQSGASVVRRPQIDDAPVVLTERERAIPRKDRPILIVDDEKNIRLTLRRTIEGLGVEVDSAEDGREALAKLREKKYGLVLLDLRMPGVDGMEVLREVRKISPDLTVIIITAYGTVPLAVEAMKLGAVDFIQKPFVPEEIRDRVAQAIHPFLESIHRDNFSRPGL